MTFYVIWNMTKRKYVAMPGRESSFTLRVEDAQKFNTLEKAHLECCSDERPMQIVPVGTKTEKTQ